MYWPTSLRIRHTPHDLIWTIKNVLLFKAKSQERIGSKRCLSPTAQVTGYRSETKSLSARRVTGEERETWMNPKLEERVVGDCAFDTIQRTWRANLVYRLRLMQMPTGGISPRCVNCRDAFVHWHLAEKRLRNISSRGKIKRGEKMTAASLV